MFSDRKDAGQRLGKALEAYLRCDGVVLAIPRGGVEVGFYAAGYLDVPLSVVIVRKLPFPDNTEAGFGAMAEDGSMYLHEEIAQGIPPETAARIRDEQQREVERRIRTLRDGKPLPNLAGKTVILVDDGVAMGSTMQAAILLCRHQNAAKVVAAAPVGGPSAVQELNKTADAVVVLETPKYFRAVAQAYQHWYDVPDEEVRRILRNPFDNSGKVVDENIGN